MIIYLLNKNFEKVRVIDDYISLIWTDRYNEAGDFELYLEATLPNVSAYQIGMYLSNTESEHMMLIETIEIKSDLEDGSKLIVSGRSLESLLTRRIVWNQTVFANKSMQYIIHQVINDAILSPSNPSRRIENFFFDDLNDEQINSIKLDKQYTGDDIYYVICALNME